MKKLFPVFLLSFFFITPAQASTPVIRIVDVPHRNFVGEFIDNQLAQSLLPDGKLGKLIFKSHAQVTWVIDASLVDDIIDMSDGYTFEKEDTSEGQIVATRWLSQLRSTTAQDPIVALAYGNPDSALAKQISKKELSFYSDEAAARLEAFLARPVISQNGWGVGRAHLSRAQQAEYKMNKNLLKSLSLVVADPEIIEKRLTLSRLLNPLISSKVRAQLFQEAQLSTHKVVKKLSVVPGRYQLTSENVKVPVTLINNFDTSVVVNLSLIPMNFRVQVANISNLELPPHSHIQLSVPFRVIAPGSTIVNAQFMANSGSMIGEPSPLNLSLTVIDSRVAWFTTAAAVALFLGAIAQSVRRVRRRGHHEK